MSPPDCTCTWTDAHGAPLEDPRFDPACFYHGDDGTMVAVVRLSALGVRPAAPEKPRAPRYEYRVRWRREEASQAATKIFQTKQGAERKAHAILALDLVKEGSQWANMPDLAEDGGPVIQRREIGEWEDAPDQVSEPSDSAVAGLEEWAIPGSQSGVSLMGTGPGDPY